MALRPRRTPPRGAEAAEQGRAGRTALLGGLLAGVLGLVLNRFELELFPAVQLLGGPLAVLAAALVLGPWGGGVAGLVAGLTTLLRWGHGWAWAGMALEGAAVGLLARRVRPVRADALYWLFGVPFITLSYHWALGVDARDAALVALKQCANGLLAALVLYGVLLVPAVRRRLGPRLPRPLARVGFADAISAALMLGTAVPLVLFGLAEGRSRYDAARAELDAQNATSARFTAAALEHALEASRQGAALLAGAVSDAPGGAALAPLLERWVRASPGVTRAIVAGPDGRVRAAFPPLPEGEPAWDEGGGQLARALAELERTGRPQLTGAFAGRTGARVAALAPVLRDGRRVGTVVLRVDLASVHERVSARVVPEQRVRILDAAGTVVVDSAGPAAGPRTLSRADASLAEALERGGPEARGVYSATPDEATLRRTTGSQAFAAATLGPLGWRVVAEQPLGLVDRTVLEGYAVLLGGLALALVAAALGSRALSRVLARPLEGVSTAAERFARGERGARAAPAAVGATDEVARLSQAFDRMAEQLVHQLESLERAGQERDQFLRAASHELKTPLATLQARVQLLARKLPPAEDHNVRQLMRQLERITRLVNQMLDVSELESGRLRLVHEPVALDAVVRSVAERRVGASPVHALALGVAPARVLGDAARLEQVVHNLVDNAVKFSPEGGPVDVSLAASGDEVVLRVADRGVGLPGEGVAGFARFPRGLQASVAQVAGLGVGLYFCREIAERHGGRIQLRPREGGGTEAEVRLPRLATPGA